MSKKPVKRAEVNTGADAEQPRAAQSITFITRRQHPGEVVAATFWSTVMIDGRITADVVSINIRMVGNEPMMIAEVVRMRDDAGKVGNYTEHYYIAHMAFEGWLGAVATEEASRS